MSILSCKEKQNFYMIIMKGKIKMYKNLAFDIKGLLTDLFFNWEDEDTGFWKHRCSFGFPRGVTID